MWVAAVVTLLAFLASATAFFHTSARLGPWVTKAAFAGVKYAPCTQSSQLKSSGSTKLYSQPTASDAQAEESQQVMSMNPRDTSIGVISKVDLSNVGEDITISPPVEGVTKIAMKFGGSSLATAERVLYVAKLIMRHVEQGYQPSIVCSAMGKTTNTLLSAGEFALQGSINVDSLRTLHLSVANTLGLSNNTMVAIEELLAELERLLEGIKYIGELTPRTKDTLVSFGERMSIRIMAATLNKLGVPAQVW
jgi:aspartate kinase